MCQPMGVSAQSETVVLKSGTQIGLRSLNTVYAREVTEGDNVRFEVVSDVKQGEKVLVPSGCIADGVVTLAKKSSIAGTKGRLYIDLKSLTLGDGTKVPLDGQVRVVGKNRTPLAVVTALFVWPCIFIPGTKAVMPAGYDVTATVVANTDIVLE